jgi:hypothetical protein
MDQDPHNSALYHNSTFFSKKKQFYFFFVRSTPHLQNIPMRILGDFVEKTCPLRFFARVAIFTLRFYKNGTLLLLVPPLVYNEALM